jgi:acyl-CoA thioester hydrolase
VTAKPELKLEDFPARTYDKIRRGEAVENHVNNILYPSFYDTGRTEITHDPALVELMSGNVWFVAHFAIDYHAEMRWPGIVEIGTSIRRSVAVPLRSTRLCSRMAFALQPASA